MGGVTRQQAVRKPCRRLLPGLECLEVTCLAVVEQQLVVGQQYGFAMAGGGGNDAVSWIPTQISRQACAGHRNFGR